MRSCNACCASASPSSSTSRCAPSVIATLGEALVAHPDVRLVSATGSTAMGRAVGAACAATFKRTILELGGNNAAIVCPTADVDLALRAIVFAAVGTAGQRCTTLRRLFVHQDMYAGFVARLRGDLCHDPHRRSARRRHARGTADRSRGLRGDVTRRWRSAQSEGGGALRRRARAWRRPPRRLLRAPRDRGDARADGHDAARDLRARSST